MHCRSDGLFIKPHFDSVVRAEGGYETVTWEGETDERPRRPGVITTKRCPHTGVVNFFVRADPYLAVGSVSQDANPQQFVWRCYLDGQGAGVANDPAIAEANLRRAIDRGRGLTQPNVN